MSAFVGVGPVFVLGSGTETTYKPVTIEFLTITGGNHTGGTGVGGGIQVRQGAYLHLQNVTVTANSANYGGGIGINTPGGPQSTLTQCVVDSNSANYGGGIYVGPQTSVNLVQCSVDGNVAAEGSGGGIYTDIGSDIGVHQTVVAGNSALAYCERNGLGPDCVPGRFGGGLYVASGLYMTNSTISGNRLELIGGQSEQVQGGGLYIALGPNQSISGTIVAHNTAQENFGAGGAGSGDGGGIFAASQNPASSLSLTGVYVIDNTATSGNAGGISNQGTLVLTNTTVAGNTGANCSGGTGCPP